MRLLRSRHRAPSCLATTLAAAMLSACAQLDQLPTPPQLDQAPETAQREMPEPVLRSAAPSVTPSANPARPDKRGASAQERGRISMYGRKFAGQKTASGELFDPEELTMAHPTLPFGTRVRVTNLENQRSVEVVVNDRGPFVPGRIADLSEAAARRIGMIADGVVEALLEIVQPAKGR